jgi:hypothetical protein
MSKMLDMEKSGYDKPNKFRSDIFGFTTMMIGKVDAYYQTKNDKRFL